MEKFSSEAVPENMSPLVRVAADAGAIEGGLGDHRDRASGGKSNVRSIAAKEKPPARRLWSAIGQVGGDGRTDIRRDRHPGLMPALAVNKHLAGSPVEIIQGQGRNLAGP